MNKIQPQKTLSNWYGSKDYKFRDVIYLNTDIQKLHGPLTKYLVYMLEDSLYEHNFLLSPQ